MEENLRAHCEDRAECFGYGIASHCSFMDIKIHIPRHHLELGGGGAGNLLQG